MGFAWSAVQLTAWALYFPSSCGPVTLGTVSTEIMCAVSKRVPRVYTSAVTVIER